MTTGGRLRTRSVKRLIWRTDSTDGRNPFVTIERRADFLYDNRGDCRTREVPTVEEIDMTGSAFSNEGARPDRALSRLGRISSEASRGPKPTMAGGRDLGIDDAAGRVSAPAPRRRSEWDNHDAMRGFPW